VRNLELRYHRATTSVIKNISISISGGEKIGIIGKVNLIISFFF